MKMKRVINFFLLAAELFVLYSMISFATGYSSSYTGPLSPPEVHLSRVTILHSQENFASKMEAPIINFTPLFGLVEFPSLRGVVKIDNSDYYLNMKHGKFFINKWGSLKGEIEIRSNSEDHMFVARGRNFKIDFKDRLISSAYPVSVMTNNLNLQGNRMVIDLRNRIIKVENGVKGEIKNFTP